MSTSVAQSDLDVSLALSLDKSLTLPVASRDKSLTLHVASSDELDVSLALSRDKSLTLPVASRDKSLTIHMASDTDLKFPYVFTLPDDKVVPPISMGTKDFGRCVGNVCTPEKTRKLLLEDIIAKGTGKRIGWSLDPKAKNTFLSGDHSFTFVDPRGWRGWVNGVKTTQRWALHLDDAAPMSSSAFSALSDMVSYLKGKMVLAPCVKQERCVLSLQQSVAASPVQPPTAVGPLSPTTPGCPFQTEVDSPARSKRPGQAKPGGSDKKVKPNADSESTSDTEVEETQLQQLQTEVQERRARLVTLAVDLKKAQRECASALKAHTAECASLRKEHAAALKVASTSHSAALKVQAAKFTADTKTQAQALATSMKATSAAEDRLRRATEQHKKRGYRTGCGAPERCSRDPCLK
jgi:hypothetical protein